MRTSAEVLLVIAMSWALACGGGGSATGGDGSGSLAGGDPGTAAPAAGTPVRVARVELASMTEVVTAPGRTTALVEQKVRAPFDGTLTALDVVEGTAVRRGQEIGTLVARDSEAALRGAQEMVSQAATPGEREEAERALELARRTLVSSPVLATVDGRVTARAASAGDYVSADQDLLTIAATGSVVFRAELPQTELGRVRPGQAATVEVAGGAEPLAARVHGFLAPAADVGLVAPLRLDFTHPGKVSSTGLYGVARIVVAEHPDVPVVPLAAVLRDDVSGIARVGTLGPGGHLHWVEVETGLQDSGRVEILSPALEAGARVVVSGQVGLAEGAPLEIRP